MLSFGGAGPPCRFANPQCGFELAAAAGFDDNEYIDARHSFWGATTASGVQQRVYDTADSANVAKVIWRLFRAAPGGPSADPWSNIVFGQLAEDTILDGTTSPLHVVATLTAASFSTVSFTAGSSVLVDSGVHIRVQGGARLTARGTNDAPISFDASSVSAKWGGFIFDSAKSATVSTIAPFEADAAAGSTLEHCTIANAGSSSVASGAVVVERGAPVIRNTVIRDSFSNGVVVDNSNSHVARAIILDATITGCLSGVVFKGTKGLGATSHVIARSSIESNGRFGVHFVTDVRQSVDFDLLVVVIAGNTINGNSKTSADGGGVRIQAGRALCENTPRRPCCTLENDTISFVSLRSAA